MFEDIGPEQIAVPPAGALEAAIRRGRTIRRQRRTAVASAAIVLSLTVIGGFTLTSPLRSSHALVVPSAPKASPDRSAIPAGWSSEKEPHLDFGILKSATSTADGTVTLHVDRMEFYFGAAAKARNHGEDPPDGYLVLDPDGHRELTFTLDPKASLQGSVELLPKPSDSYTGPHPLTLAEFLQAARNANHPYVWLRHLGGSDGPVTALSEQYTP